MCISLAALVALTLEVEIGGAVELMGHRSWHVREAAVRRASSLGYFSSRKLRIAARGHPSAEVRRRCGDALCRWYTVLPTRYPMRTYPRISFLPFPPPPQDWLPVHRLGNSYAKRAFAEVGRGPYDTDLRYATQLYVCDLLDAGTPRAAIVDLLNRMAEDERRWWLRTPRAARQGMPAGLK